MESISLKYNYGFVTASFSVKTTDSLRILARAVLSKLDEIISRSLHKLIVRKERGFSGYLKTLIGFFCAPKDIPKSQIVGLFLHGDNICWFRVSNTFPLWIKLSSDSVSIEKILKYCIVWQDKHTMSTNKIYGNKLKQVSKIYENYKQGVITWFLIFS